MRFANFEGILGFSVPSIILADLLGNTCLLVIGAFRSTLFVSVFQGSLLVIALFRIVSSLGRPVFFEAMYDLSYSCSLAKISPLIIAISFAILERFRVILDFVFAGQAGRMVICINSTPTQMIDGTEKHAARYNEFGYKKICMTTFH